MALTGTEAQLANAIVAQLKTINPELTGDAEADAIQVWTLIANALIPHLVTNIQVATTTTGVSAGVTSGPSSAPTTGTGT